MRNITKQASEAFYKNLSYKKNNTEVIVEEDEIKLFLHGHKIAWMKNGTLFFSMCGFNTQTTRERLQAANITIAQRNHQAVIFNIVFDENNEIVRPGSFIDPKKTYYIPLEQ